MRVFCGHLEGRNQTAESARERLPWFLEECHSREHAVFASAVTDSEKGDYNVESHVQQITSLNPDALEVANEPYHKSQRQAIHTRQYLLQLKQLARNTGYQGLICLGTDEIDENRADGPDKGKYGMRGGDFNNIHLNRNKPPAFREACRIKEQNDVAEGENVPSLNGEPRRAEDWNEAWESILFCYLNGLLGRGFSIGTVFHSAQARDTEVLTGIQLEAARAFVRGHRVLQGDSSFMWKNANNFGSWRDSAIRDALFFEPEEKYPGPHRCWRAYTFFGDRNSNNYVVLAGPPLEKWQDTGVEFQNGWHPVELVDAIPGCFVLRISQ